ncbi:hypothetical protein [Streptosporangium sp. NPDC006007]|uniref:hypothetical protein n=1 Tax=Streptosporangium sp. NPDC006007 TaxID=3154575 RepID=UPI0033A077C3
MSEACGVVTQLPFEVGQGRVEPLKIEVKAMEAAKSKGVVTTEPNPLLGIRCRDFLRDPATSHTAISVKPPILRRTP